MRFYLIGLLTVLMAANASAQTVNIGIKGGLNVDNIRNSSSFTYDNKLGFHVGLLGHIHITDQLGLQPEIVYSTQGAQYTFANVTTKIKNDYINVPVLFQYMFGDGFRLMAGPQIGFLVSSKYKTGDNMIDNKNNLEKVDLGLALGVSYVHTSGFGMDVRYNLGLRNINNHDYLKSTNRGFQVGLFYLFGHKS